MKSPALRHGARTRPPTGPRPRPPGDGATGARIGAHCGGLTVLPAREDARSITREASADRLRSFWSSEITRPSRRPGTRSPTGRWGDHRVFGITTGSPRSTQPRQPPSIDTTFV